MNDSKMQEIVAVSRQIGEAIQAAADEAAIKALAFTQALAAYDRRLKRKGLWPGVEWTAR